MWYGRVDTVDLLPIACVVELFSMKNFFKQGTLVRSSTAPSLDPLQ